MRRKFLTLCLLFGCLVPAAAADDLQVLPLWPGEVPGESGLSEDFLQKVKLAEAKNTADRTFGVTSPTLTVYPAAADTSVGTSVLVCPGGGYHILAWDHEGRAIAEWLNSIGVHAFVLTYRVPRRPDDFMTPPLQDAQRAMRLIRSQKTGVTVDPQRIGILGFSAGGHLAVNTSIQAAQTSYKAVDDADKVSAKPNFMIPIYAAYLGHSDDDSLLDPTLNLTSDTPPMFTAVTQDDKNRGIHAALLFAELTRVKVPAEVHVFTKGGHGYGMRKTENAVSGWPKACQAWMKSQGLLSK